MNNFELLLKRIKKFPIYVEEKDKDNKNIFKKLVEKCLNNLYEVDVDRSYKEKMIYRIGDTYYKESKMIFALYVCHRSPDKKLTDNMFIVND